MNERGRVEWSGLIAATHTPLRADGALNPERIPAQAGHLAAMGVRRVFVCGSTGECHSLSLEERMTMARCWSDVARESGMELILHVGHNCWEDARRLATHAAELGVRAISAMPPCYFKPAGVEELVRCCEAVASAAPGVRFYYYHIPGMSGVSLPMDEFLRRGAERIPTLAGLKYSDPDLVQLQRCLRVNAGRFEIFFGCDEMLLPAVVLGVHGAIGSSYNYAAPLYHALLEAYFQGEIAEARTLQHEAVRMIDLQAPLGAIASGKAIMSWHGLDCGPVRLPLRTPTTEEMQALRKEWDRWPRLREALGA